MSRLAARASKLAAVLTLLASLAGCGGGSVDDGTDAARVRLVHALPEVATLDAAIDGDTRWSAVGFQGFGAYQDADAGNRDVEVYATGSASAILSASFSLDAGERYTYVAWGTRAAPATMLLLDDTGSPDNGRFKLKLAHAAAGGGTVDVYVTATGTPLADATPAFTSLAAGGISAFTQIAYGTLRIRVTVAGSKDLVYDSGTLRFEEGEVWTAVLIQRGSGRLVNLALLETGDDGAARLADNALAQVRVVHAAPGTSAVSARVDGALAASSVPYRASTAYLAVDAGERRLALESAGTPGAEIAALARAFAPATDSTVVLAGSPGATVAWTLDDRNLPPAANRARLRFVNAAAGAGDLDFTVDYARRAQSVAPRSASDYLELEDDVYAIGVNAAGSTAALRVLDAVELEAGRTYSLFVIGEADALEAVVVRDD